MEIKRSTRSGWELIESVRRAHAFYRQPIGWPKMQTSAIRQDFSWNRSAQAYANLSVVGPPAVGGKRSGAERDARKGDRLTGSWRTAAGEILKPHGASEHVMGTIDLTERIRRRAYEIWESEGAAHGRDHLHWLRAGAEIREGLKAPGPTERRQSKSTRVNVPPSRPPSKAS